MREHVGRVLSALVALPLLYGAVRFLPLPLFAVLIAAVVFLAQIEFYRMTLDRRDGPAGRRARYAVAGVGAAAGTGIVVIASQPAWAAGLPLLATALVMAVGVTALARGNDLASRERGGQDWRQASTDAALAVFGVWYVAWLFAHLVSLRELRGGEWLGVFVLWGAGKAAARAPSQPQENGGGRGGRRGGERGRRGDRGGVVHRRVFLAGSRRRGGPPPAPRPSRALFFF